MIAIQLDFLKTPAQCFEEKIVSDLEKVRKSGDAVRKGTYARLNEQKKEIDDLKSRLVILERFICKIETPKKLIEFKGPLFDHMKLKGNL
jgi:hypothetical protein